MGVAQRHLGSGGERPRQMVDQRGPGQGGVDVGGAEDAQGHGLARNIDSACPAARSRAQPSSKPTASASQSAHSAER